MTSISLEYLRQEFLFQGRWKNFRKSSIPDIGVITNIGDAHSENFPDNKIKAEEKLKLFKNSSLIIYCRDQELIHRVISSNNKILKSRKLVDWST